MMVRRGGIQHCFFPCKVMAALSDAKYQERTPYLAKTFLEAFRK